MPVRPRRNAPAVAVLFDVTLACAIALIPATPLAAQQLLTASDIRTCSPEGEAPSISAARLNISFETADPGRLTKVELWYTQDQAVTWHRQTGVQPEAGGIAFAPPADGLYGFYIVLHNAGGASAPDPKPGTQPQHWVRIDRAAPMVQLLQLSPDDNFHLNRAILLRWAAQDDNLPDRPVAIHYRTAQTKRFQLVAESLAANSAYRWTVPENVSGKVEIKVTAVDRAGHHGRYIADWLRMKGEEVWDVRAGQQEGGGRGLTDSNPSRKPGALNGNIENNSPSLGIMPIPSAFSGRESKETGSDGWEVSGTSRESRASGTNESWYRSSLGDPTGDPAGDSAGDPIGATPNLPVDANRVPIDRSAVLNNPSPVVDDSDTGLEGANLTLRPSAAKEAKKRYDLGTWYRLRGEHEVAIVRFREALAIEPNLVQAQNDLAGLLYVTGDHAGAEREYEALLEKQPRHRNALKSLAFVQAARNKFDCSIETLQKLLLLDGEDAEAWLHLGDVRMYMGDRLAAREAWTKARSIESAEPEIVQRAKKRLEAFPQESQAAAN